MVKLNAQPQLLITVKEEKAHASINKTTSNDEWTASKVQRGSPLSQIIPPPPIKHLNSRNARDVKTMKSPQSRSQSKHRIIQTPAQTSMSMFHM